MLAQVWQVVRRAWAAVQGIVRSYAEIFFLSKTAVGCVLVVGTLLNWRIGAAGLLSVVSAYVFARLTRMDPRTLQSGYYTYNPLLVGLSLGATLAWSWLTALLICTAGVLTFLLTSAIVHVLRIYFQLPPLSLPFVLASAVMHTAVLRYSNLTHNTATLHPLLADDFNLPPVVVGFCKSLGAIVFVPSVAAGGLFALLLLVRSRILFGLAVAGYCLGTFLRAALLGSDVQALDDVYGFNFILIGMAVGGVFLVPSGTSFLIAAAAICTAIVLVDAVQVLGAFLSVPAYTLPFNLVTLGVLYALGVNQYSGIAKVVGTTPEETMENDVAARRRFQDAGRTLTLPFYGGWTVWQAFDDEWTHQGPWQHAYDFVIAGDDGETFTGGGARLDDYLCYRKPVVAPCRGRVVKVVDDLADNAIGRVDKTHNWGNHVVIHDDRGFYVALAHFAPGSIKVRPGERVEPGRLLGLCGNSGYSPQPHLHIHVQATEQIDAGTLPFNFVRFRQAGEVLAQARPRKGCIVEPIAIDERLDAAMEFLLNDRLTFDVVRPPRTRGRAETLQLAVKMALDGTLYFDAPGRGKLYFGKLDGTFYCYRLEGRDELLSLLFLALPKLPLVRAGRDSWSDAIPVGLATRGARRWAAWFVAPFYAPAAAAATSHRYLNDDTIETTVTLPLGLGSIVAQVQLDDCYGIAAVRTPGLELHVRRRPEIVRKQFQDDEPRRTPLSLAAASA